MRKIRNVISVAVISAILICGAREFASLANNWQDTNFDFHFNGEMVYTSARAKEDASKVYMKCLSITSGTSYTAHVVGCTSYTAPFTNVDCSRGNSYLFDGPGVYHYMTSWVYEEGYPYARVACSPNYGYPFSASGVWSPDNKNGY